MWLPMTTNSATMTVISMISLSLVNQCIKVGDGHCHSWSFFIKLIFPCLSLFIHMFWYKFAYEFVWWCYVLFFLCLYIVQFWQEGWNELIVLDHFHQLCCLLDKNFTKTNMLTEIVVNHIDFFSMRVYFGQPWNFQSIWVVFKSLTIHLRWWRNEVASSQLFFPRIP